MRTDHGLRIEVIQDRSADFIEVSIEVLSEIHDQHDSLFIHRDDHLGLRIREQILQDLEALDTVVLADTYDKYDTACRKRDLIFSCLQRNIAGQLIFEKDILDKCLTLHICVALTHRGLDPLGHQLEIRLGRRIDTADKCDVLRRISDNDLHVCLSRRIREQLIGKKNGSGAGILDSLPCRIGAGYDHTRCIHDAHCQIKDLLCFAHTLL